MPEKASGVDAAAGAPRPRWKKDWWKHFVLGKKLDHIGHNTPECRAAMNRYLAPCTECHSIVGLQHKPSCHRQGLVTPTLDYRQAKDFPATGADATGAASNKKDSPAC